MGWTRRAPPQPAASGGVLSSPGLFGVPHSAKYAGLPPLDHPARGHSPDEIRRLAARAASPRCRNSSGNSLCGQNSAGFRESARPFKGIICDDISEFESPRAKPARGRDAMSSTERCLVGQQEAHTKAPRRRARTQMMGRVRAILPGARRARTPGRQPRELRHGGHACFDCSRHSGVHCARLH